MQRGDRELEDVLRRDLRHRRRPMAGRDPRERGRSATPLELLYDLTYVIAFAAAAEQLAELISENHAGPGIGAYAFAVFSVSWAWLNFTWFNSAYGNDDVLVRLATIVQMVGVVILIFGLQVSFAAAAEGESPNNLLMVVGYVVMRVPLIALWLRASRQDPERRRTAVAYALTIVVAQAGWIATAVLPLPLPATVAALVVLALAEMVAPVVIESRLGRPPWNPGHIAERFSLITLITLGEVIAATTAAVAALVQEQGWTPAAVVLSASGLICAAALWWAYFLIPSRPILERWPDRTYAWRYAHLPMFGSIAAVGAGLRVSASAVEKGDLSLLTIALSLALPLACVLATIFVTWSVLLHAYDLSHVPLFALSLLPLGAAVIVGTASGDAEAGGAAHGSSLVSLVVIVALVALGAIIEVVGHEMVGFRHTLRALRRQEKDR